MRIAHHRLQISVDDHGKIPAVALHGIAQQFFLRRLVLGPVQLLIKLLHLILKGFQELLAKQVFSAKSVEGAAFDGFGQGFTLTAK